MVIVGVNGSGKTTLSKVLTGVYRASFGTVCYDGQDVEHLRKDSLDPLAEYDIFTRFLDLIQGKTSVIISHRGGICRSADKIVVMKDGRVVECGTHEQLCKAGGEYTRIWTEQAKWY